MVKFKKSFDRASLLRSLKFNEERLKEMQNNLDLMEIEREEDGNYMWINPVFIIGEQCVDMDEFGDPVFEPDFRCFRFDSRNLCLSEDLEEFKESVFNYDFSDEVNYCLVFGGDKLMLRNELNKICIEIEKAMSYFNENGKIPGKGDFDIFESRLIYEAKIFTLDDEIKKTKDYMKTIVEKIESIKLDMATEEKVSEMRTPLLNRYFSGEIYKVENKEQISELLQVYTNPYSLDKTGEISCEDLGLKDDNEFPKFVCLKEGDAGFLGSSDERIPVDIWEILEKANKDVASAIEDKETLQRLLAS